MASRYDDDEEYEYQRPRKKSSSGGKKRSSSDTRRPSGSSGGKKSSGSRKGSERKMSQKARAKKKRRRILLFILEIVVLVVMVLVLWTVTKTEKVGKLDIPEDEIIVNEGVEDIEVLKGYWNIALFGVDSTTGALTKNTRSDTIMIASINQDTQEVKLISIYRDSFLNLGNDTYNKCNAAYAKGGPKQAMNMLNQNLDLNITDFVTIGFEGLADTIDSLGGVEIEVKSDEITHLNNYQKCIAEDLKRTYTPVSNTGTQVLDGLQATGYCRIRYTAGDDFKRAERQRTVLKAVMEKAKGASVSQLTSIANSVFDEVYTSFDISEIVSLLGDVSSYSIVADDGFPQEDMRWVGSVGSKGSCVVPTDLSDNVTWLHGYLFDETDYQPSTQVQEYSDKIKAETGSYVK